MTVDLQPAPFRLVLRQVSEMLFAQGERFQLLVPHPQVARTAFVVVLGGSIAHLPWRSGEGDRQWLGIDAAVRRGRAVSATAVAASMRLPPTTVRRQLATLVDAGLLVRERSGFLVDPAFLANPACSDTIATDAEAFLMTVRALAASGYAPATAVLASGVDWLPPALISRQLAALSLRIMETTIERFGDFVTSHIHAAITIANVEHITRDPALARRFAREDQPPPDDLRQPITARRLADRAGLPFETVRRRLLALAARGEVETGPGGVIVPTRVLTSAEHMVVARGIVRMFASNLEMLSVFARTARKSGDAAR